MFGRWNNLLASNANASTYTVFEGDIIMTEDDFNIEDLPWADGCNPKNQHDREHKQRVKKHNRTPRQRKKKRDAIDTFNANRPVGTLRKFYI